MPDLKRYRDKRDPARTPEPFGEDRDTRARAPGQAGVFVVQQHAARNMHWDLRLEIDGVLSSWAVPKGPSLDPAERRFAARTEDHPLEYADFEGVIPQGNYGAGTMIVWDRGAFSPAADKSASQGLADGKLDLIFSGHKLRGRFALVRMKGEDGKSWLLLHKGQAVGEEGEIVETHPASVLSGLTIQEVGESASRSEELESLGRENRAPRRALSVDDLRPMLAATSDTPFSREGWLFELKYDGARVIASKSGDGRTVLRSRTGRDVSATYPEITRAVAQLPAAEFAIDGEVVSLDARGRSSFERLQRRFSLSEPAEIARAELETPVVLYVFDLLSAEGRDLRRSPLWVRKQMLAVLAPRLGFLRFADHVEGDGEALFEAARDSDLEGVLAKRATGSYESGRRSQSWLKIKVPRRAELVVVGSVGGRGSRVELGSLMLAWWREGEFCYAGNVGSGLSDENIRDLLERLDALGCREPEFSGAPGARRETYCRPELVCEVGFTEVTSGGLLRHPVFEGLCPGVDPKECRAPLDREKALAAAPAARARVAELELTRLDKVFWPVDGYKKGDLLAYYEAIWPWLAPYLRDRPVVLTRYPDGVEGKSFYQKNAPDFTPDWALRETIEGTDYFICNDLRTLLYVVNSGAIPLHVWSARRMALDRPDWLILDLDPKEAPFAHVVKIARHIHALLQGLDADHFVKTSGQDGMHVLIPLGGELEHTEVRQLAEALARTVCAELPEIATIARPLAARADKVYVDYLQNGRGKLIAAPLSVRPRAGAPVSMPLRWTQVNARLDPSRWTIATAAARLRKSGDPMSDVLGPGIDVARALERLAQRLEKPRRSRS